MKINLTVMTVLMGTPQVVLVVNSTQFDLNLIISAKVMAELAVSNAMSKLICAESAVN